MIYLTLQCDNCGAKRIITGTSAAARPKLAKAMEKLRRRGWSHNYSTSSSRCPDCYRQGRVPYQERKGGTP